MSTRAELLKAIQEQERLLQESKRKLEAIEREEKAENIKTVKGFIAEYKLKPLDLFTRAEWQEQVGGSAPVAATKQPKKSGERTYTVYFNPENPSETWERRPGRAVAPEWFLKIKNLPNLADYTVKTEATPTAG